VDLAVARDRAGSGGVDSRGSMEGVLVCSFHRNWMSSMFRLRVELVCSIPLNNRRIDMVVLVLRRRVVGELVV